MDGEHVEGICQWCGEKFGENLSSSNRRRRKYCSATCSAKAQWKRYYDIHGENNGEKKPNFTGICAYCGKEFSRYIPPIDLVKDIPRCCSTSCKSKYQWKDRKLQIGDMLRKCKYCGKEFVHCKGHQSQKYCSLKCANAYATEHAPDNNRVLTCKHCGKEFIRELTDKELAKGKGKYCSRECYDAHIAWEPRYCEQCGKPLKRGYGDKYCSKKCAGLGRRHENGYIVPAGYIMITVENGRKVQQHRYVMEQVLGRILLPNEVVHHKNGIRHDNDPSNLELWVERHPYGQRVDDLIDFVVKQYRKEVLEALSQVHDNNEQQLNSQDTG